MNIEKEILKLLFGGAAILYLTSGLQKIFPNFKTETFAAILMISGIIFQLVIK